MRQTISNLDHSLSARLHLRPHSLHLVFGWLTILGHPATVLFIAGFGLLCGLGTENQRLIEVFIAAIIAYFLCTLLKLTLRRPRPQTPYASAMLHTSFSFPSGHAFGSLVIYGCLAYFASLYFEPTWAFIATSGLWLMIFLIGLSRVYLGAHFVIDVIGGWLLSGAALAWIVIVVAG